MSGRYDHLAREDLIALLEKRDRQKKFGLIWEREEIETDRAIDDNFIVCDVMEDLCERSAPWSNLIIEGDNFDALRWLRMSYAQQVKCIYIDPPYNTGNKDWVYNDHYMSADDNYRHSTWLEFLYRRLCLARTLLRDDGVILISINDDNRAKLEMLCEEALPGMHLGSLVWRNRTGGNDAKGPFLSTNHEHILIYGHPDFRFGGTEKTLDMYKHSDPESGERWSSDNLTKAHNSIERPNGYYPLFDQQTDIYYPANPDAVWRYVSEKSATKKQKVRTKTMEEWIAAGQILFPEDQRVEIWPTRAALDAAIAKGDVPKAGRSLFLRAEMDDLDFWVGKKVGFGTPRFKRYQKDLNNLTQPLSSWVVPRSEEKDTECEGVTAIVSGTNDEAAKTIRDLFGGKAFNYAKPPSLLQELIRQASSPGDLICDFFAGSGTTAHAVMALNAEEDSLGDRSWILVSSSEATTAEPDKNICRDVTANRIRHLNRDQSGKYKDWAAGFAYLRCREIPFQDVDFELTSEQVWLCLLACYHLPLYPWHAEDRFQLAETETTQIAYVDVLDDDGIAALTKAAQRTKPVVVFSWAPAQISAALHPLKVETQQVWDYLVSRFLP